MANFEMKSWTYNAEVHFSNGQVLVFRERSIEASTLKEAYSLATDEFEEKIASKDRAIISFDIFGVRRKS